MKQFLFVISLSISYFASQAQAASDEPLRQQPVVNYDKLKSADNYKRAAYLDIGSLITDGSIHVGYYNKLSKKDFWELGAKFGVLSNPITELFLKANTTKIYQDSLGQFKAYSIKYLNSKINFGIQGGISECLYGNPLTSNFTFGMRVSYLNTLMYYNVSNRDTITGAVTSVTKENFSANTLSVNPILSTRIKLKNGLLLEGSGILSYNMNSANLKQIGNLELYAYTRRVPAIIIGLRLVKVF